MMLRRARLWWRWRRVLGDLTDDERILLRRAASGRLDPCWLRANLHNRVVVLMFQRWAP